MERNYNTYLLGMEKGNADKLFFLNHLCLDDYDYIVDFGCGRGDIIKTCAKQCKAKCYGIDKDPYMRNVAGENCKDTNVILLESLNELNIPLDARVLFIFSSVLHEVGKYWHTGIEPFLKKYHSDDYRCTLVIRDMYFPWMCEDEPINKNDLANIIANSNPSMLSDFVRKYGMKTKRDMYHYLLKYSYVDNWELELDEDYFSFCWDWSFLSKEVYDRKYTLPFKKERVKLDFDIDLDYPTHRQLIVNF